MVWPSKRLYHPVSLDLAVSRFVQRQIHPRETRGRETSRAAGGGDNGSFFNLTHLTADGHLAQSECDPVGTIVADVGTQYGPFDVWVEAGMYHVTWTGRNSAGNPVASGLYMVRLTGEGHTAVRKALLLK